MKIGILTHFGSFTDSYALHVGWLERAKLLQYFGQNFDFLVNDNCPQGLYPNQVNCLGRIGSDAPFASRVEFFWNNYEQVLGKYDAVLTADILYQKGGNFLAQNAALREAAKRMKATRFYHWIHSAWVNRPRDVQYPESLRFQDMPNSTFVYMNESEMDGVARMYGVPINRVACVYNPKDYRSFNDFHPLAWQVTRCLDIPDADVVQILPLCSTRMDAKGIDVTAKIFGALKAYGKKVALVIANANARKVQKELEFKRRLYRSFGLEYGVDWMFTHELTDCAPLPRKAVADLFKVSNLFAFSSWREVNPNVLLEAKISGNLLAVNERVKPLREFAGENAVFFEATYKTPGVLDNETGDLQKVTYANEDIYWRMAAGMILKKLPDRKHLWEYSYESIWHKQFKPLLYGADSGRMAA